MIQRMSCLLHTFFLNWSYTFKHSLQRGHFSNSSISAIKKKREEVCEAQCSCKFISSTFKLGKHCCFGGVCVWNGGVFINCVNLYLHGGFSFAPGITSLWLIAVKESEMFLPSCWKVSVILATFAVEEYLKAKSSCSAKDRTRSYHALPVVWI